jgi:hypothetical protein
VSDLRFGSDRRHRCEKNHLVCENCWDCRCNEQDSIEQGEIYALRVSTDRHGKTLCPGCREEYNR